MFHFQYLKRYVAFFLLKRITYMDPALWKICKDVPCIFEGLGFMLRTGELKGHNEEINILG